MVSSLARSPRGVPVPITLADASLEQVLAAAPKVQNVLPEGSTWDGKTDLPMDEATFQQMVSEIEPGTRRPAAAARRQRIRRARQGAGAARRRRTAAEAQLTHERRCPSGCS